MSLVETVAQRFVDNAEFSNVEWAIQHKGSTVDAGIVGYANFNDRTPVPKDAFYRIYSMTKPIVSVAALMLVQEQKLKLYDPVAKYIPAFAGQKILQQDGTLLDNPGYTTIEHLLTHRAGLSYDFIPNCPVAELYRQSALVGNSTSTLKEFIDELASFPIASVPGSTWRYSYATDVLARVIELVSDQPIDEFLRARILDPLDMPDTDYSVPEPKLSRLMPMYGARSLGEIMAPPPAKQILQSTDAEPSYPSTPNNQFRRGGHGLFSTTKDYLNFCQFMHTGQSSSGQTLLHKSVFDMMWANRLTPDYLPLSIGPNAFPGYGWNLAGRVMVDIGQSLIVTTPGEGGWSGAASTYFWIDRKREVSGVVMSQFLGSALGLGSDIHGAANVMLDQILAGNSP